MEPRAIEGRRPGPDDPDTVDDLSAAAGPRTVQPAGDDRDVVVDSERLAQLGEQVRGRLDAGPVVLVEDEETGAAGGCPSAGTATGRRRARTAATNASTLGS